MKLILIVTSVTLLIWNTSCSLIISEFDGVGEALETYYDPLMETITGGSARADPFRKMTIDQKAMFCSSVLKAKFFKPTDSVENHMETASTFLQDLDRIQLKVEDTLKYEETLVCVKGEQITQFMMLNCLASDQIELKASLYIENGFSFIFRRTLNTQPVLLLGLAEPSLKKDIGLQNEELLETHFLTHVKDDEPIEGSLCSLSRRLQFRFCGLTYDTSNEISRLRTFYILVKENLCRKMHVFLNPESGFHKIHVLFCIIDEGESFSSHYVFQDPSNSNSIIAADNNGLIKDDNQNIIQLKLKARYVDVPALVNRNLPINN